MQIRQQQIRFDELDQPSFASLQDIEPQLILVFAAAHLMADGRLHRQLRAAFPTAQLAGCSTAGEITAMGVDDDTVVLTALHFVHPAFRVVTTELTDMADSQAAGGRLAQQLAAAELRHVLLFAQGVEINGSALIEGLASQADSRPMISGGLAGDGGAFIRTWTLATTGVGDRQLVAIGFYGDQCRFAYGSFGGWQAFGPMRRVTRAVGNVLFELDGAPALDIYKRYLGEYAQELPASGLLFPFLMRTSNQEAAGLIRTILGIDESNGALILAGDILTDSYLQLMHASTEALVDGASAAAEAVYQTSAAASGDALNLLVSCVGRKLVMGARVDEEVEAVADVLGSNNVIAGFYSYGEISPSLATVECNLHNQTMTIARMFELPGE